MARPGRAAPFWPAIVASMLAAWTAEAQQGPVAYWKGDEADPPPGNVADDSAGTYDGAYQNGATTVGPLPGTPAAFAFPNGRCMTFAGGAQPAAHVSVPDAPALRVTGDFTVAFWMRKTGDVSDWARMVGKGNSTQRNFGVWEWAGSDGRILFQQYDASGNAILNLSSTLQTGANSWYHIACQIQGGTARMYINGALHVTGTRTGTPGTSSDPLTIGAAAFHQGFQGQIDDVRLYARALSAGEVDALYRGYTEPAAPSLTGSAGIMRVDLSWTPAPDPNIPGYTIQRALASGGPWADVATSYTSNSYTDTNVNPLEVYYYRVLAVNGLGSAVSNTVGPLQVQPYPPRTNDHEEGLVDGRCGCGTSGPAPAGPALAAALLGVAVLRRR
ncbi:MAG TPA: LamG-like jellyroll fold domain-containing protein [Planctomycetota bacterium]|nr:LamG-like jellyroll fold domain-containing protein [Planctomycetota bacterium]